MWMPPCCRFVGNETGAVKLEGIASAMALSMNQHLWCANTGGYCDPNFNPAPPLPLGGGDGDHFVTQWDGPAYMDGASTRDFVDYDANLISCAHGVSNRERPGRGLSLFLDAPHAHLAAAGTRPGCSTRLTLRLRACQRCPRTTQAAVTTGAPGPAAFSRASMPASAALAKPSSRSGASQPCRLCPFHLSALSPLPTRLNSYYGNDDVTSGNVGDSWCAMGRIAWFDALSRRRYGDLDGFNDLLLGPLQTLLLGTTWMHERIMCDGQEQLNRTAMCT